MRLLSECLYVTNANSFFCAFRTRENGLKEVKINLSMSMLTAAAKQNRAKPAHVYGKKPLVVATPATIKCCESFPENCCCSPLCYTSYLTLIVMLCTVIIMERFNRRH